MIESDSTNSETQPDEFVDYQRGIGVGFSKPGEAGMTTSKSRRIYCFACHRMEYHYNALKGTAYHYLLIGFTFGLAAVFGPYRCRCCGHRRFVRYNFLNPRFHYHRLKYSGSSKSSNRKRKSDSTRSNPSDLNELPENDSVVPDVSADNADKKKRRQRKKGIKLKSVQRVDSIGKERRKKKEEQQLQQFASGSLDFSIDGVVSSFETEESRKMVQAKLLEERARKEPLVPKKAKPRKKPRGKPKRRFARKERLNGPTIYCFTCQQNNEHFHVLKGTSYYFFLFGISFGLIELVGPFRCSVCNKKRLGIANFLNPKYYVRHFIARGGGGYG